LLSQDEVEKIHNAALEILETVGMKVDSRQAIKIYQSAGARIEDGGIVKISPSMIQKAIAKCVPKFSLYHRNTNEEMVLGDGTTKYSPNGWTSEVLDWRTGAYRKATISDMVEVVKMCGAIDEIDYFFAPLICSDVKASDMELYQYKIGAEHANKPMILSVSDTKVLDKIMHLGAILAGGKEQLVSKPDFLVNIGIMSPLFMPEDICDLTMACAELGIPISLYASSAAGGTSPVTLSGTLAGNHAEILAAITLAKLVNPDINILHAIYSKSFDMREADVLTGNPEYSLLKAASIQLGNYIGLPTLAGMLYSDSPKLDIQAGIEKVGCSFLTMLSGADASAGMGLLSKLMIFSMESLVIDAEIVAYFNRIMKGINCDEEHLAVDVYQKVGPAGEFLSHDHTRHFFRNELWYSNLANRMSFSSWDSDGRKVSMESNVKNVIEITLQVYQSPRFPDGFVEEFERIKAE